MSSTAAILLGHHRAERRPWYSVGNGALLFLLALVAVGAVIMGTPQMIEDLVASTLGL